MAKYGILRSSTNTGNDGELVCTFIAPLSIISNKPTYANETVTLKRRAIYTDIQRWEIEAGMAPVEDGSDWFVHNVTNGYSETFFVRMPQIYRKKNISDKLTPKVFADVAGKLDEIYVKDMLSLALPVGEFVRFKGHGKVYMVKESVKVDGGLNRITIFPKLIQEIAANEEIEYGSRVTMRAKYGDSNKIGISYTDGILAQVDQITLIEAL